MAGGMDWFRWHHGTVTDQKFQTIAKRAGGRVADVIAVWACLLEAASTAEERGNAGAPDFESIDLALGMADGLSQAIYVAMQAKGLIEASGQLVAWERRQPKREREDSTAADRKRLQRERERDAGAPAAGTPSHTDEDHVTPGHATSHQVTPRGEEKRVEEKEQETPGANAPSSPASPATADGNQPPAEPKPTKKSTPPCPHQEILVLFAEKLPMLSQPNRDMWGGTREEHLRTRWKWLFTTKRKTGERAGQLYAETQQQGLEWFAKYFDVVAESDFLTGRRKGDDTKWTCTLEWLVNETNFAKVASGNYANKDSQ